ncbi:Iron-sulfur cluster assembly enzyme ISCU, mitochondrial [Temnothorax longispinosus]|uniref:Iron-sulfur cluster assembly enzyme ISCU n=1 Tax=Temnothorax longispinosus TaxID=300112 RepID=A0A4S2KK68_9HYME|nr:Iron-sulfur cluster assembly enzyme ISCU, mitochondrial [Temnothorax longispinosus]
MALFRALPVRIGATSKIVSRSVPALYYHANVLDHYENPRNVGSLDKNDEHVGTGLVGAPACGDVMKLQIRVDESGKIIDAKFKTFGCGSAIASSSLATEWVKGKTVDEALSLKNTDIAKELCLPPVKLHCSTSQQHCISRMRQTLCTTFRKCKNLIKYLMEHQDFVILVQFFLQIAVLAEDAIKAALSDYRIKRQSKTKEKDEATN